MENKTFCQCCAMPMDKPEDFGTNADKSRNDDYCVYCMVDGNFTSNESMDEMIESCIQPCIDAGVYKTADEARASMQQFFPTLKRWAK